MTNREIFIAHKGTQASSYLDFIRGIAAIAVFLGHARYLYFVKYHSLVNYSLIHFSLGNKIFYMLTGLGRQCVIIFFVMSGYCISSNILRNLAEDNWTWEKYLINRCNRLYVVLLPALLLTLFWDHLGMILSNHSTVYQGIGTQGVVGNVISKTNLTTFLGNIFFLQNLKVPVLGSNEPLWSLSYEYWYYILFPLLLFSFHKTQRFLKSIQLFSLALIIGYFFREVIPLFPIWLFGAGLSLLAKNQLLQRVVLYRLCLILTGCGFLVTLVLSKGLFSNNQIVADYLVGIGFLIFMYVLIHDDRRVKNKFTKLASLLANMSYTLYLVHMPFLVFLYVILIKQGFWLPNEGHMLAFSGICILTFMYAFFISRITEAKTEKFKKMIFSLLQYLRNSPVKSIE